MPTNRTRRVRRAADRPARPAPIVATDQITALLTQFLRSQDQTNAQLSELSERLSRIEAAVARGAAQEHAGPVEPSDTPAGDILYLGNHWYGTAGPDGLKQWEAGDDEHRVLQAFRRAPRMDLETVAGRAALPEVRARQILTHLGMRLPPTAIQFPAEGSEGTGGVFTVAVAPWPPERTPLTPRIIEGGFVLAGHKENLSGLPLAVLKSFCESRTRRRTAEHLKRLWGPGGCDDRNVRDAVATARAALKRALTACGADGTIDPFTCLGRGRDLAWDLRLS